MERLSRLDRRCRSSCRLLLSGVLAVVTSSGCAEIAVGLGEVGNNWAFSPRERLSFACDFPPTVEPFPDSLSVPYAAFDGPEQERPHVAVLVVPSWYGRWTLHPRTVDGRPFLGRCSSTTTRSGSVYGEGKEPNPPEGTRTNECLRLALLPGSRIITLSAVSDGRGSVWDDTKVKGARIDGTVVFPARAGGLYSVHACLPKESQQALFWVRDETSLACVSAGCPPSEELPRWESPRVGDWRHVDGCHRGKLVIREVTLWSRGGGLSTGATVVGNLSGGDADADPEGRCLGDVVIVRDVRAHSGRTWVNVETVIGSQSGWIHATLLGPPADKAICSSPRFLLDTDALRKCSQ
jgi:hypothetical protein